MNWTPARLGDLIAPVPRPVDVKPTELYREIGIRSYGNGIFHKPPVSGLEIGEKRVFRIEPGDFVVNIVFAWEGAVAIAGNSEAGMIGSHRFPVFRAISDRINLRYLLYYFRTQPGLDLLLRVSPGGAGRNRTLGKAEFLNQTIPIPPPHEQSKIVSRIEELSSKVAEASRLCADIETEIFEVLSSELWNCFGRHRTSNKKAGDYFFVQSGFAFKSGDFASDGIKLVKNINISHGFIDWADTSKVTEETAGKYTKFLLREGDVLISLDRPIISTGLKIARVSASDLPALLVQRVGRIIMNKNHLSPDYIYYWMRSPLFMNAIDPGRSNGVPHISQKDIEKLPFDGDICNAEQVHVVRHLVALDKKIDHIKSIHRKRYNEIKALTPAILSQALSGEL